MEPYVPLYPEMATWDWIQDFDNALQNSKFVPTGPETGEKTVITLGGQ